jgi:hypothetical protein
MRMAAKMVRLPNMPDHHRYQRPDPLVVPRKVRMSLMILVILEH